MRKSKKRENLNQYFNVGMKQTIPDIIRENEDLRKVLLAQEGGIMKYLAEHLDIRGSELFKKYQDQCDEDYFESQEWNMSMTLPRDEMRRIALSSKHLEDELSYLVQLKTAMDGIPSEIINFVDGYLRYAYLECRKRRYPNGVTCEELYDEVMGIYRPGGLANDCMKIVIMEHRSQGKMKETLWIRNTMFYIRMYSWVLSDLQIESKLRQAVSKKLEGKTQEECRHIAVTMMKEVKDFTRMIYSDCLTTVNYCDGNGDVVVDKEWLRDVAKEGVLRELNKKKKSARFYFSDFVYLLMTIGHIWAAQMLVHGIDMHELETETGCILNPAEKEDLYYYVDNLPGDNGLSKRYVVDEDHARELLSKIHKLCNPPEELLTDEAHVYWKQLRENRFIVTNGYALAKDVSPYDATFIADHFSDNLKIKNKWKVFEALWGIKHMAQKLGDIRKGTASVPHQKKINEIFGVIPKKLEKL